MQLLLNTNTLEVTMKKQIWLILSEITARISNFRRHRFPLCWGVRLRMYRSLAYKHIEDGKWGMIRLYSGMQTPLIDAVEYLVAINDTLSIPRLRKLLTKYLVTPTNKGKIYDYGDGQVCHLFGPMDYMPERIQTAIIYALLELYTKDEATVFAKELLAEAEENGLCEDSLWAITRFLGLQYIGRGYWKNDEKYTAPFTVPANTIVLQQGYRGYKNGGFIEYFLLYADKDAYVISKRSEAANGIAWITAVLVTGKSQERNRAVKVKYILHEDGSGVLDGCEFDWDFYHESYADFEHLWLRFRNGILPDIRLEPAV